MKGYILQDIRIRYKNLNFFKFLYHIFCTPGIRLIVSCRICKILKQNKLLHVGGYFLARLHHMHLQHRYLVCFDDKLEFGEGLCFPHGGPFVINENAKIGKCCTIHPNVLIGGDRGKGVPTIGDYVFIGNGAKIIGNCKIGDWCFISPAAVITKDIPEGCLVGYGLNNILNMNGKRHVEMYL